ncbi:glycosyltransferase family 4 protein [Leptospira kanakyensis]|uniref:glycosyltransferase family 4 protein n=1 Tax=Leptospira kanakyensis TaxID=2484968 RepID=UPI00223DCA77|nr:glycosyltransferase family 4 protein [Leptospira kanakyensis]MCW7471377.1 glycosyltransferase family 4 protein [Leptospira kanakyensis]
MKVLIIVDDYLPKSVKITGKMIHELALEFVKQGHFVSVVTPDTTQKEISKIENYEGVNVLRFRSGRIKNVNKVIRLFNELLLSYRAWICFRKWLLNNRHELVVYYSPSIFWAPLVEKLVNIWKCPTYLILRDFFPQWVIDSGMISGDSFIAKFFRYFEYRNYKVASRIGVMSIANAKWFKENFPKLKNVEILYNWTSPKQIITKVSLRKKYSLGEKIVFFYGGNIGHAQYMKNLLDLASKLDNRKDVFFVFIGAGDEEDLVREYILRQNLTNCILLESVSQDIFESYLAEADIGMFTLHPDHKTHNFPGKILGYIQVGLPILGAVNRGNDLKDLINEAEAGYISESGDLDLLYQNALKLLDSNTRKRMGRNAESLLNKQFSTFAAVKKISDFV